MFFRKMINAHLWFKNCHPEMKWKPVDSNQTYNSLFSSLLLPHLLSAPHSSPLHVPLFFTRLSALGSSPLNTPLLSVTVFAAKLRLSLKNCSLTVLIGQEEVKALSSCVTLREAISSLECQSRQRRMYTYSSKIQTLPRDKFKAKVLLYDLHECLQLVICRSKPDPRETPLNWSNNDLIVLLLVGVSLWHWA